ncbi:MAG TPA: hypothetical protein DCX54_03290 [Flavobacteriales bacterium]|nr:hypothetical protein [Flavobacteriales bacterium]
MKTKVLFVALFSLLSLLSFGQEDAENSYILICNGNEASFIVKDYVACNTVSIRDSEHKVASFLFVGIKKSKRIEIEISGDELTEEALKIIDKLGAPLRVRVEKVLDETGTPVEGFRELTIIE